MISHQCSGQSKTPRSEMVCGTLETEVMTSKRKLFSTSSLLHLILRETVSSEITNSKSLVRKKIDTGAIDRGKLMAEMIVPGLDLMRVEAISIMVRRLGDLTL